MGVGGGDEAGACWAGVRTVCCLFQCICLRFDVPICFPFSNHQYMLCSPRYVLSITQIGSLISIFRRQGALLAPAPRRRESGQELEQARHCSLVHGFPRPSFTSAMAGCGGNAALLRPLAVCAACGACCRQRSLLLPCSSNHPIAGDACDSPPARRRRLLV